VTETTLDWIDAALDADAPITSDPLGREVQELALALRAESPAPDPEFAAWLEDRVEAGFPRRRAVRVPRPRTLALGGALAAAAAVVVAVAVGTGGQSPAPTVATQPAQAPSVQEPAPSADSELRKNASIADTVGSSARVPRSPLLVQPPNLFDANGRLVQRSAEITLAAPEKRLSDVADGVIAVTGRHHGFVQHEDISTGVPQAGGSLDLRVPVGELDATLRDLSGVADVRARTETADDVTRRYAALSAELAQARTRRLEPLRHGLRQPLRVDDARIRRLSSELRALNQEAKFSDVAVTLQVERHGAVAGSSTRRALDDAADTFVDVFDGAIRALGVLVPLAVLAAALWLAGRSLRRRRREAVLA
jgi:hypothetical protein